MLARQVQCRLKAAIAIREEIRDLSSVLAERQQRLMLRLRVMLSLARVAAVENLAAAVANFQAFARWRFIARNGRFSMGTGHSATPKAGARRISQPSTPKL